MVGGSAGAAFSRAGGRYASCFDTTRMRNTLLCLIMIFLAQALYGAANSYYVSPVASAAGDGSLQNPWTLATALLNNKNGESKNSNVKGGDIIWLLEGTYYGPFSCDLMGSAEAPIAIKPRPGARVRLVATNNLMTCMTINGGWVHFSDLEVCNSATNRSAARNPGLMVFGPGTKLINLGHS